MRAGHPSFLGDCRDGGGETDYDSDYDVLHFRAPRVRYCADLTSMRVRRTSWWLVTFLAVVLCLPAPIWSTEAAPDWASQVVIHRDEWGVPHIKAPTDAAVAFGSAYAQCEDHFFQLEDTYIKSLGRYAEIVGESGLQSDLEVALFDLVATSQRDFGALPENIRRISEAFAAGYNHYLARHPEEKPRLLERMEPFHVLAFERYMILGRLLGAAHAPRRSLGPMAEELAASLGSNQWAVAPSKTRDGHAMLFINPHQPCLQVPFCRRLRDSKRSFARTSFVHLRRRCWREKV